MGGVEKLRTDSAHPASAGTLCTRGSTIGSVVCCRCYSTRLWRRYEAGLDQVRATRRWCGARIAVRRPGLPVKTESCGLPGVLEDDVCEQWLLHGTKKDNLLDILSNGPNERYSGGLFGNGTYLAEDAKTDHVGVDSKYDRSRRSTSGSTPVCATRSSTCWLPRRARSRAHEGAARENPKSMDGALHAVFAAPTNTREFAAVPSTQPPPLPRTRRRVRQGDRALPRVCRLPPSMSTPSTRSPPAVYGWSGPVA